MCREGKNAWTGDATTSLFPGSSAVACAWIGAGGEALLQVLRVDGTGDTVHWLRKAQCRNGPKPEGMQRGTRQRVPLAKMRGRYYHAHLARASAQIVDS